MELATKKLSVAFLFDDTLDSSDGVAQYVKTVGSWLSQQGHTVSYMVGQTQSSSWRGGKIYPLSKNLRISWAGNKLSIPLYPRFDSINSVLSSNDFDVVHAQLPFSPLMAKQVIDRLHSSTALVGTFHVFPANKLSEVGSLFLKILYGKSLNRFDRQLSVSSAARKYAKESFSIESEVVPNAVDISKFKPAKTSNYKDKPKKIVFLGRLVARKGCIYLLKAFESVRKQNPSVELIIAGDGPEGPRLKKYVKDKVLGDSVKFIGYVEENDKPALLADASIACYPSLYGESFGIVLIEAMAAGAGVVIGGNNPGYKSTLGEGAYLTFDPKDTGKFSTILNILLNNAELSKSLHRAQQDEVKKFDVNIVGPQVATAYIQAIDKRKSEGHNYNK